MTDIVGPVEGDFVDPEWAQRVTDAVNSLQPRVSSLEALTPRERQGVVLRRVANQSVNNNTLGTLSYDTEDYDTDGFFNPGNPTQVSIPIGLAGLYLVTAQTQLVGALGGARNFIVINWLAAPTGTPTYNLGSWNGTSDDNGTVTAHVPLEETNVFQVQVLQNSGGARNFIGYLSAHRIGE